MNKKRSVLHVDDDEDIRLITRMAFDLDGRFELHQAASGVAAIDKARSIEPDLFLLDVMMPGMSGMEAWDRLRSIPGFEHVPAIFMTAKAENSVSSELIELGAAAVITKPFDPMTVCDEITGILNGIADVVPISVRVGG